MRGTKVQNEGWELTPLEPSDKDVPEYLQIRGYKLARHGEKVLKFTEPGDYVVEGDL